MTYYKKHLFFCTNLKQEGNCCGKHDAMALKDYAKARLKALGEHGAGRVRISHSGCLGRCDEGPCLVIYPEGVWYTYHSKEDIDEIIGSHVEKGQPVPRLLLKEAPEGQSVS